MKYGVSSKRNRAEYCRRELQNRMHKSPIGRLLSVAKYRARKQNLEFSITKEDLVVPEHCPILGIKLSFNPGKRMDNTYSLDRVNPSLGYVPGNVRVISWRANRMKWNMTVENLEKLLTYMKDQ